MFYMNMKVFNESSGNHGLMGRIAKEKYEAEKKRNDDIDNKRNRYKKSGYLDKAPKKPDRSTEKDFKDIAKSDKDMKNDGYKDSIKNGQTSYITFYDKYKGGIKNRANCINTQKAKDIADEYVKRREENNSKVNHAVHDRINNRAKNESVGIFSCLETL